MRKVRLQMRVTLLGERIRQRTCWWAFGVDHNRNNRIELGKDSQKAATETHRRVCTRQRRGVSDRHPAQPPTSSNRTSRAARAFGPFGSVPVCFARPTFATTLLGRPSVRAVGRAVLAERGRAQTAGTNNLGIALSHRGCRHGSDMRRVHRCSSPPSPADWRDHDRRRRICCGRSAA